MASALDNLNKAVNTVYTLGIIGIVGVGGYLVYETIYGDPCSADSLIGKATSFLPYNPVCESRSILSFFTDLENIGPGVPVELEPCPAGWSNDGLTCREPISCASGLDFFAHGCSGGNIVGRLNNGGVCPSDHPEKIDGMCYKPCPAGTVHTEGMPYTCRKVGHDFGTAITAGFSLPSWLGG